MAVPCGAGVYRFAAAGKIKGWHPERYQPVPYGGIMALGPHSCVALSPMMAAALYHAVPEA